MKDGEIAKIAAGRCFSLFLDNCGVIWSCGHNSYGQLGYGDFEVYEGGLPKMMMSLVKDKVCVIEIDCGGYHAICLDVEQKIYSWGYNTKGQCGDGTTNDINRPKLISSVVDKKFGKIQCGYYHSYSWCDCEDKHYLFGDNGQQQCRLKMGGNVLKPFCINDVFASMSGGRIIVNVFVGNNNTFILAKWADISTHIR